MKFDVVTLFPTFFDAPMKEGVVGSAVTGGLLDFKTWNPRDYAKDRHKSVDDRPFGGGDGMVMLPEILKATLDDIQSKSPSNKRRVIYLSPQGPVLTQQKAKELTQDYDQLVLICGRYGGIDERIIENEIDEELSIGNYILSGGEPAALVLIDVVSRYIPGVLGNDQSVIKETFEDQLLEQPLYTRPRDFNGKMVPEVLLSGHHSKITDWIRKERIRRTLKKRPDLLSSSGVSRKEVEEATGVNLGKVAVGLVHYPVYSKTGEVVATNVTNFDIHDIARSCRTYGIENYYIITPTPEQSAFVSRVLQHWHSGRGFQYNPTRTDSLRNTRVAQSLEAALEDFGAHGVRLVATSARQIAGPKPLSFGALRTLSFEEPIFLVFGTGYGLENGLVRQCDYLLDPIQGRADDGFRHLSVRSAVSIVLDRLYGSCY